MRRREFLAASAGSLGSLAGCQAVNPFGGPRDPVWQTRVGEGLSTRVVRAGDLVVANTGEAVTALDRSNGDSTWTHEAGDLRQRGLAATSDAVYAATADQRVAKLTADGGDIRWHTDSVGPDPLSGIAVDPNTERVIATTVDGTTSGVEPSSGDVRWRYETEGDLHSRAAFADGTVYVASTDGRLIAIDGRDGEERWRTPLGSKTVATPTVADGTVCVGTVGGAVVAVDAASGRERWRFATRETRSSPVVTDGVAYLSNLDGLAAIDVETRAVQWHFDDYYPNAGPPAIGSEHVFVGGKQKFNAVDRTTGEHRWQADLPNTGHLPPVVGDERVYVGDGSAFVSALELS